jgi:hypothetical protein
MSLDKVTGSVFLLVERNELTHNITAFRRRFWGQATARKDQLSILAQRIADLEVALASVESSHPMLAEELLAIKTPFQRQDGSRFDFGLSSSTTPPIPIDVKEEEELSQALGSLVISNGARTRYVGSCTIAWVCLLSFVCS